MDIGPCGEAKEGKELGARWRNLQGTASAAESPRKCVGRRRIYARCMSGAGTQLTWNINETVNAANERAVTPRALEANGV